ncbi:hypothetical protein L7F22_062770 [Adiantum nelumboides]|nr:hypothetical protein [Adiantum nelumboides]
MYMQQTLPSLRVGADLPSADNHAMMQERGSASPPRELYNKRETGADRGPRPHTTSKKETAADRGPRQQQAHLTSSSSMGLYSSMMSAKERERERVIEREPIHMHYVEHAWLVALLLRDQHWQMQPAQSTKKRTSLQVDDLRALDTLIAENSFTGMAIGAMMIGLLREGLEEEMERDPLVCVIVTEWVLKCVLVEQFLQAGEAGILGGSEAAQFSQAGEVGIQAGELDERERPLLCGWPCAWLSRLCSALRDKCRQRRLCAQAFGCTNLVQARVGLCASCGAAQGGSVPLLWCSDGSVPDFVQAKSCALALPLSKEAEDRGRPAHKAGEDRGE